jgi:hypothetical protein
MGDLSPDPILRLSECLILDRFGLDQLEQKRRMVTQVACRLWDDTLEPRSRRSNSSTKTSITLTGLLSLMYPLRQAGNKAPRLRS